MSGPPMSERGGAGPSQRPGRSEQERVDRARMRTIAAVVTGLVVGVLFSFAQTHLAGVLSPLVDSASLWLLAPFVLGALMRTPRGSIAAGTVCAVLQLGACTGAGALRGVGIDTSLVWFWLACSVVLGPLFGAGGHLLRRGPRDRRGLGGGLLAAAFIAEGIWNDFHELHDNGSGWLWVGVGLALCAVLLPTAERLRWMACTLPAMAIAEFGLTLIHR